MIKRFNRCTLVTLLALANLGFWVPSSMAAATALQRNRNELRNDAEDLKALRRQLAQAKKRGASKQQIQQLERRISAKQQEIKNDKVAVRDARRGGR